MRPLVGLQMGALGVDLIAGGKVALVHSPTLQIEIGFAHTGAHYCCCCCRCRGRHEVTFGQRQSGKEKRRGLNVNQRRQGIGGGRSGGRAQTLGWIVWRSAKSGNRKIISRLIYINKLMAFEAKTNFKKITFVDSSPPPIRLLRPFWGSSRRARPEPRRLWARSWAAWSPFFFRHPRPGRRVWWWRSSCYHSCNSPKC